MNAKIYCFESNSLDKNNMSVEFCDSEMNFSKICRTCLTETEDNDLSNESLCIINSSGKLVRIYEMIEATTGLKISSNDVFPHHICTTCLQSVNNCYRFRSESQRADEILRTVLLSCADRKNDIYETNSVEEEINEEVLQELEELEEEEQLQEEEQLHEEDHFKEEEQLQDEEEFQDEGQFQEEEPLPPEKQLLTTEERLSEQELIEIDIEQEEFSQEETEAKYQISVSDDSLSDIAVIFENDEKTISEVPRISIPPTIKCEFCDNLFALQRDIIQHYKDSHPSEKPFKCEVCSVTFVHIQSMRRHKKTHIASAKEKMCPYCSRTFHRSDDLTRHMRIHTDERPFRCDICQKAFKQHTELKDHMLSHRTEKQFKCVPCKREWRSRNAWYLHMKAHQEGRALGSQRRKRKTIEDIVS